MNKNFSLIKKDRVEEYNSDAYLYEHKKTKAQVLYLIDKEESNKTFGITFKTLPPDSTGVAHILEHSVLCGSKKYPLRKPFVELIKTSQSTFLNAMTFPDKTMYPVASKNNVDFRNLMDVYLDAVFNPIISESIFKQEGYSYGIDENNKVTLSGVVYNEMKAARSGIDDIIEDTSMNLLFADTRYSYDSGGIPNKIRTLKYTDFIDFHKKYYNPSNSTTFFHGDVDVEKTLAHLDEYFSEYGYLQTEEIEEQKPFKKIVRKNVHFPSEKEDKEHMLLGYLVRSNISSIENKGLSVLNHYFFNSENSILKQKILNKQLADSLIDFGYEEEFKQRIVVTGVKGMNIEAKNHLEIEKIFNESFLSSSKSVDKNTIQASINRTVFERFEMDSGRYPRGVLLLRHVQMAWLYGNDPIDELKFLETKKELMSALETDFFENLIKKYFVDNKNRIVVRLLPDKKAIKEELKNEKDAIDIFGRSLSEKERKQLRVETKKLKTWQNTPDSEETKIKIPRLDLKDISDVAEFTPIQVTKVKETEIIHSNIDAGDVVYLNLIVDISHINPKNYSLLKILSEYMLKCSTKSKGYEKVALEVDTYTGGVSTNVVVSRNIKTRQIIRKLIFSTKFSKENFDKASDLLIEIAQNPIFNNTDRTQTILNEMKSEVEAALLEYGHRYSLKRSFSGLTFASDASEKFAGVTFYKNLKRALKNTTETTKSLSNLHENVIKGNVQLHVASNLEIYSNISNKLESLTKLFTVNSMIENKANFLPAYSNHAYTVSAPVGYVSQAFNLPTDSLNSGNIYTVEHILNTDYLWNEIRVKSGAYGAFAYYSEIESIFGFVSYRDPNIEKTFDTYNKTAKYLTELEISDTSFEGYLLGAISSQDSYETKEQKSTTSLTRYLLGIDQAWLNERRAGLLSTQKDDLKKFAQVLDSVKPSEMSRTILASKENLHDGKFGECNFKIDSI